MISDEQFKEMALIELADGKPMMSSASKPELQGILVGASGEYAVVSEMFDRVTRLPESVDSVEAFEAYAAEA